MRLLFTLVLVSSVSSSAFGQTYSISTLAGGGTPANIPGTAASLYGPTSVAVDKAGGVFFSDRNAVLRLDVVTGLLRLIAGNGEPGFSGDNGLATNAQLAQPGGVALDSTGNLFIADTNNNRIRKVTNGVITTVAGTGGFGYVGDGGPATSAVLFAPNAVAVDSAGNLYIADTGNHRVCQIRRGVITTVAGRGYGGYGGDGGPAINALLQWPRGVAADSSGNLYIADTGNNRIRKVANGVITTVAGNGTADWGDVTGPAINVTLPSPLAPTIDGAGNLYMIGGDGLVLKLANGITTIVAARCCYGGDDGPVTSADLRQPVGLALDSAGNLYIAASGSYRILKAANRLITTVAGNGSLGLSPDNVSSTSAQLNSPADIAVDSYHNIYITDGFNNRIRKVSNGVITTIAGSGTEGFGGDGGPATNAQLYLPSGVAVDSAGSLYIADTGNNTVRKVSNGIITTVAGSPYKPPGFSGDNGPATSAQLYYPSAVAVDPAGNLYIVDSEYSRVRKVSGGVITTVAGNGTSGFSGDNGPANNAQLNGVGGIAADSAGNLFVADVGNYRIRKISNGVITTVAGNGTTGFSGDGNSATNAQLGCPASVTVDAAGNLYIADQWNYRIRKVADGVITTIAGTGVQGFGGDGGPATIAGLNNPSGVAGDSDGNLYIADSGNDVIRVLTPGATPAISHLGMVPVSGSIPSLQSGSWVSVFGSNLASGTYLWKGDFPISLGETTVTIGGKPSFLWYVSPTQINLQVPDDIATGLVSVVVTTAFGSAASGVTMSPYGPSFSLLGDGKHVAGEIATPNGAGAYGGGTYDLVGPSDTFSFNTRPVKVGESLILYGVGFGPTTPVVPAGTAFSGAATATTPITITLGGVPADVAFAGITAAGLFQFNLTVPSAARSGEQALQAVVNGVQTPLGPLVTVQ